MNLSQFKPFKQYFF